MINLLPLDLKQERRFGRTNKVVISAVIAVMIIVLICVCIMLFSFQQIRSEENSVKAETAANEAELAALKTKQQQVDQVAKQLDIIKKLQQNEVNFSEVVPQIGSIIPQGAILTSLSLTGQKDQPLQLSFKLKSQELASVVQQNIVGSPIFESADILSLSNNTGGDDREGTSPYGYSATVVVSFEGAPKKPAAAPAAGATQ